MSRNRQSADSNLIPGGRRQSSAQRGGRRWFAVVAAFVLAGPASAETWHRLVVAPEHRCWAYDKKRDYPCPQSVEADIVRTLGMVFGPYTGRCFDSTRDTDIESCGVQHISMSVSVIDAEHVPVYGRRRWGSERGL